MSRANPVGTSGSSDNLPGVNEVGSRHQPYVYACMGSHETGPCSHPLHNHETGLHELPPPRETYEAPADSPGMAHLRGATGQLIEFMLLHGVHGGTFDFDSMPDVLRLDCDVCGVNVQVLRSELARFTPTSARQREESGA